MSTFNPHRPSYALLDKITQTFDFPDCWGALNVNANDLGFYRVWYDPDLFAKLRREWDRLSEEERVDVVSDTWAMVLSNRSPISTYLTLLEGLGGETSYSVWHNILQALIAMDRLEQGQPGRAAYQAYVCSLLNPLLERLGWYPNNDEELATKLFRNELIEALGVFGDRSVINEAFERFEQLHKDPDSIAPDLRGAVVAVVGRYSSETVYTQLHQLAREATLLEAKDDYYHAMECALDPKLAEKTLELAIGQELSPAESAGAFAKVASEGEHADLAWNFVKERLDLLEKDRSQTLWTVLVPSIVEGLYDRDTANEILNLSKNRATANGLTRTQMAADLLQVRAKLRERLLPDIDDWVKKRAGTRVEALAKSSAVTGTFTASAARPLNAVSTIGANNPTPTPTPEPSAVKIVVSQQPKETPVPAASPPAIATGSPPPVRPVAVPTPTPTPASLSMIQSTPQPAPTVVPQPSPTVESMPTPSPIPVASGSPVAPPIPAESPKSEENPANVPPSPTASPEASPTVEQRVAKHRATPKPQPTPTSTPKPKTLLGKIFDSLRKANEEAGKPTPTPSDGHYAMPTPTVRYWASPTPKPKRSKTEPSPTNSVYTDH